MINEKVQIARNLGNEFIRQLEQDDKGKVRSRHKSSIVEIRKIMTRFEMEAEREGVVIAAEPREALKIADIILFGIVIAGAFAMITLWFGWGVS